MPLPNASCTVALPRERNNATDAGHATGDATATAKSTLKAASLQELRTQLRAQLVRNQSAERETEKQTELRTSESATATVHEVFCFSPPGDPANDAEALEERAAIIAEGCGIDQAAALQEARWQADRERCWLVFLRNAQRVLEAPAHEREGLLARYRIEAARR